MSRTVTLTQSQSRTRAPVHLKLNPDPNPGDDDDNGSDGDSPPLPNPDYHQLPCDIRRILFVFKLGDVLKETKGNTHFANVSKTVHSLFKEETEKTGEFQTLHSHFFKPNRSTATLRILNTPEDAYVLRKGDMWCFVRCRSNRIKIVPFDRIPKDSLAYHRYMCDQEAPKRPMSGRLSVSESLKRDALKGCDNQKMKDNFRRERSDTQRHREALKSCPSASASKRCAAVAQKGCDSAEETKDSHLMAAIYDYGKRVHPANALRSWEEICDSVIPPVQHAKTVGGFPYILKPVTEGKTKGYKVCKGTKPDKCFSKHPLPKETAQKQRIAITLSELSRRKKGVA